MEGVQKLKNFADALKRSPLLHSGARGESLYLASQQRNIKGHPQRMSKVLRGEVGSKMQTFADSRGKEMSKVGSGLVRFFFLRYLCHY